MRQRFVDLRKLRIIVAYQSLSWNQIFAQARLNKNCYRYFNGIREVPLDVALKVAYILKVHPKNFLTPDTMWLLNNMEKNQ